MKNSRWPNFRLCFMVMIIALLSRPAIAKPFEIWFWPEKTEVGSFTLRGGQQTDLVYDMKHEQANFTNRYAVIWLDAKLGGKATFNSYYAFNNAYPTGGLMICHLFINYPVSNGSFQAGKVQLPFSYFNGYSPYYTDLRLMTRLWDIGIKYSSNNKTGLNYEVAVVNDGTRLTSDMKPSESDKMAIVTRVSHKSRSGNIIGVSGFSANDRNVPGIGKVDLHRLGAHGTFPCGDNEFKFEFASFKSFTDGGVLSPKFADKWGTGFTVEAIHNCHENLQYWLMYSKLRKISSDPNTCLTQVVVGSDIKLTRGLFVVPSLWFNDDKMKAKDNIYRISLLSVF